IPSEIVHSISICSLSRSRVKILIAPSELVQRKPTLLASMRGLDSHALGGDQNDLTHVGQVVAVVLGNVTKLESLVEGFVVFATVDANDHALSNVRMLVAGSIGALVTDVVNYERLRHENLQCVTLSPT